MKSPKFLPTLLGLAFALLSSSSFVSANGEPSGILGDLTVTVEEQENGDIRFTLSGSAPIKEDGYIYTTPTAFDSETSTYIPPSTRMDYSTFPLPPGLMFATGAIPLSEPEPDGPEEGGSMYGGEFPVYEVVFGSGGWYLNYYSGGVSIGETLMGIGSVTVSPSDMPTVTADPEVEETPAPVSPLSFSDFVPGTYPVQGYYFDITYVVVPYVETMPISTAAPSISVQRPRPFRRTFVGRTSRTQVVKIRNTGDAPLLGLSTSVVGPASRDFRTSAPRPRRVRPGGLASSRVIFRPTQPGIRRAFLVVEGNAPSVAVPLLGRAVGPGSILRAPLRPIK